MTSYKDALKVLKKVEKKLAKKGADHPVFKGDLVCVMHNDGTSLFYTNAIMYKWNRWLFVIAEHIAHQIFPIGDLIYYRQYSPADRDITLDDNGNDNGYD